MTEDFDKDREKKAEENTENQQNIYTVGNSTHASEMPAGYSSDFRANGTSANNGYTTHTQNTNGYTSNDNGNRSYYNGNTYTYASYTPPYSDASVRNPEKKSKHGRGGLIALAVVGVLILSLMMGFVGAALMYTIDTRREEKNDNYYNDTLDDGTHQSGLIPENNSTVVIHKNPSSVITTSGQVGDENLSYADVAALVKDSVVEISTNYVVSGSMFSQYVSSGAGSGVIIAQEGNVGYIVTNNHVIDGASSIKVRLTDSTEMDATLVGADAMTDIAVLKVTVDKNLTVATLGDSDSLAVGQEVIAIGNPLGQLGGTVTNGIISALARQVEISGEKMTLLQTNAAVNPGNSGGGLFNMRGELIGVVNAKSSGDDVEGLGFAIPVNVAYATIVELIEHGYVRNRPALGITVQEAKRQYFVYYYTCVYVTDPGSTDLNKGDIITRIEGNTISSIDDMTAAISGKAVGDVVEITVVRNNVEVTVKVTLVEYVPE